MTAAQPNIAGPASQRLAQVTTWAATLPPGASCLVETTGGDHVVTIAPNGDEFLALCSTCPFIGQAESPTDAANLLYVHVIHRTGS